MTERTYPDYVITSAARGVLEAVRRFLAENPGALGGGDVNENVQMLRSAGDGGRERVQ